MSTRIHIVLDELEASRFRARAATEGRSLSEWLREAARERLAATASPSLRDPGALRAFFVECDARDQGPEPDWAEHLAVIEASRMQGLPRP